MRSIALVSSVLAILFFQSCTTTKPAVYPEPLIGSASFDYWIHSPLHPRQQEEVQFEAAIVDPNGIVKIELYIYEYELYTNEEGLPSKRRRADSQWGLVQSWEYEHALPKATVSFDLSTGFQDFSNVEYIFKVIDVNDAVSERLALFDAGKSPWEDEKILLYATTRKPLKETINLCFLPDTDYQQNWTGFLTDVEQLIYKGYHANNKIAANKELWQFYYTPQEMDGKAISTSYYDKSLYPDFMTTSSIQGVDAFGLLHQSPYGDGAYLKRNLRFLAYNFFTSESYNHGTAVHETAHAIFNLSDEYDQCACFENPRGANVFATLNSCQAFNKKHGFPVEECSSIKHVNGKDWYMSEANVYFPTEAACTQYNAEQGHKENNCERFIDIDGKQSYRSLDGLCIMQDDGDEIVRDFKRTCGSIIETYYKKIRSKAGRFLANQETQENIFGYEPVVLMELQSRQSTISFAAKDTINGVPSKHYAPREAYQVDFLNEEGLKTQSMSIGNPKEFMIHGHGVGEELIELEEATYRFTIPYKNSNDKIEITRIEK